MSKRGRDANYSPRTIVGEPVPGVLIVNYEGYGRRLVPASASRSQTVWRKRCLHRRTIGLDTDHVQPGDELTWIQICRLCAYELEQFDKAAAAI